MINQNLIKKAQAGDADAMVALGYEYYRGEEEETRAQALPLFEAALRKNPGNRWAAYFSGHCFYFGTGVAQNTVKAKELYRKAAETGLFNAFIVLANILEDENDPECLIWYQMAFERGDSEAAFRMGKIYLEGAIVPENADKAGMYLQAAEKTGSIDAEYYWARATLDVARTEEAKRVGVSLMRKAAEGGHGGAMAELGRILFYGENTEMNKPEAMQWFEKARKFGDPAARCMSCFYLGYYFEDSDNPDYGKAAAYYEEAYHLGNSGFAFAAAARLSNMYHSGIGTAKDPVRAYELAKYAADHGDITGKGMVGFDLITGEGTEKDIKKGIEYLEDAIEGGNKGAKMLLAKVYMSDEYQECVDPKKKFDFLLPIAEDGNVDAVWEIYLAYAYGRGTAPDKVRKLEWLKKAADLGDDRAQTLWAYSRIDEGNYAEAAVYLEKAAAQGNDSAMYELSGIYSSGADGVPANKARAAELLRQSADAGNKGAQVDLGVCYMKGDGVPEDHSEAFRWFEKSAAHGSLAGIYNLAFCLLHGDGCKKNAVRAVSLLEDAVSHGTDPGPLDAGIMIDIYWLLGVTCWSGADGVPEDTAKAKASFISCIDTCKRTGVRSSSYYCAAGALGEIYINEPDFYSAFPCFMEVSQAPDSEQKIRGIARLHLAEYYKNGWAPSLTGGKNISRALQMARMSYQDGTEDARSLIDELKYIKMRQGL